MKISVIHHGHILAETTAGSGRARITVRLGGWLSWLVIQIDVEVSQ